MKTFVYFLDPVSRASPDAIAAHVAHLRALDDAGALVVCGPFVDGSGGVVCVTAASTEEADRIARSDPFVALGVRTYRLRELERATRDNGYLG
ncbi:MAG: YciI family protein [Polyangiales bacterium]